MTKPSKFPLVAAILVAGVFALHARPARAADSGAMPSANAAGAAGALCAAVLMSLATVARRRNDG